MRFFVLEHRKRHFSGLNCQKKKLEQWSILDKNHGLTPLEKFEFFDFLNSCFYSLEKRFLLQNIAKDIFLAYIRKKVGKIAIFGQKPWVNPFGNMSIFRLFELLVFIA